MTRAFRHLLIAIASCVTSGAGAQTYVSGTINVNTSFDAAGSPYIVLGDLTVLESATLAIGPGVEIQVDSGKKIEIRGAVFANGTAAAPIYIHGRTINGNNSMQFWKGFVLTAGGALGPRASFDWCKVSNAIRGLDLDLAYAGPYHFRNCTFTYNTAINYDGGLGGTFFDSCAFVNNYYALTPFQYGGKVSRSRFDSNAFAVEGVDSVTGCTFTNNTGIALQPKRWATGNEITANNVGVSGAFGACIFTENKIKANAVGVRMSGFNNVTSIFKDNEICGNRQYNLDYTAAAACDLSMNCWCTGDSAAIRAKINDGYRTAGRGTVGYIPFNTGCTGPLNIGRQGGKSTGLVISPNPLPAGIPLYIVIPDHRASAVRIAVLDALGRSVAYHPVVLDNGQLALRFSQTLASGMYVVAARGADGHPHIARFVVR